jgi:hypothetical protein
MISRGEIQNKEKTRKMFFSLKQEGLRADIEEWEEDLLKGRIRVLKR